LDLGTPAPAFQLEDVASGDTISLDTFSDAKALLVMFICRHCPFVRHVEQELAKIGKDYQGKPLGIVAISANDAKNYPADAPDRLREMVQELGFIFPLCFDGDQAVAKAYTAACTPDFFVFDGDRNLVYRGQLDDSRPGNDKPVTGQDLRGALDTVLAGESVPTDQQPSIGCTLNGYQVTSRLTSAASPLRFPMAKQKSSGGGRKPAKGERVAYAEFGSQATERATQRATPSRPPNEQKLRVQVSRKGRKGKTVTVINGFETTPEILAALLKTLKGRCGAGGTVKDDTVEIQGDHAQTILQVLVQQGYAAKISGGK
ncbi:MAG: translation initiation factor, partial [Elainellaceae cyanobacterium]